MPPAIEKPKPWGPRVSWTRKIDEKPRRRSEEELDTETEPKLGDCELASVLSSNSGSPLSLTRRE